jgi:hypothetical protein
MVIDEDTEIKRYVANVDINLAYYYQNKITIPYNVRMYNGEEECMKHLNFFDKYSIFSRNNKNNVSKQFGYFKAAKYRNYCFHHPPFQNNCTCANCIYTCGPLTSHHLLIWCYIQPEKEYTHVLFPTRDINFINKNYNLKGIKN